MPTSVPVGTLNTVFVSTKCSGSNWTLEADQRTYALRRSLTLLLCWMFIDLAPYATNNEARRFLKLQVTKSLTRDYEHWWMGEWRKVERAANMIGTFTDQLGIPVCVSRPQNRWLNNPTAHWFILSSVNWNVWHDSLGRRSVGRSPWGTPVLHSKLSAHGARYSED